MKRTKLVAINGEVFKPEDAKISVFDRGFMYGDAIYEVARSYGRIFFELESHIQRMFNSASAIQLDLRLSQQDYIKEIYRIYSKISDKNLYMRIQITRGTNNTIGLGMKNTEGPNVIIYLRDIDPTPSEYYEKGAKIVTSQRQRNTKKALDPNIKSGNYLNNVLAYVDATSADAIESIMVNASGQVTEGTTSNIFRVQHGVVINPPDDFDILRGITRGIIIQLCKQLNIPHNETGFTPAELENSDEVFLTSSVREIVPIRQVNSKVIATCPGPITQKLALAYKDYVKRYCDERKHLGVRP
jgi:branched-chain amino acid aminotransferase